MSFTGDKRPSGYKIGQLQQFTPEQMQLFQQMFGNLGPNSFLSKLAQGDQLQFAAMEAPALKQFSGFQGNLASRFSGMGSGALNSSGFQNASNQAASDFAQQLQSQRLDYQRQAISDLMGLSNQLLGQRPYERFLVQKPESSWNNIAGSFANAIPGAFSSFSSGNPLNFLSSLMGSNSTNQSASPYSGSQQMANYQFNPYVKGYY